MGTTEQSPLTSTCSRVKIFRCALILTADAGALCGTARALSPRGGRAHSSVIPLDGEQTNVMFDFVTVAAIGGTFLLAGGVKGVIGLGLPTVSLGLLTAALDLTTAMALLIVPSFVTNFWQAMAGGNRWGTSPANMAISLDGNGNRLAWRDRPDSFGFVRSSPHCSVGFWWPTQH